MMPLELTDWARRHGISETAMADLALIFGAERTAADGSGSEARVQSEVRLAGAERGYRLFRNNVGVLKNEQGTPVRYGLANDSSKLNKRLKSSDLIGWCPRVVTVDMVGQKIAQFVAIECKPMAWRYAGSDREQAQQRFIALVSIDGGFARFATGPEIFKHG